MFVEKEIRNFTLSNGSSVQIVVDSPFFYVYVDGTRFRTNEQPASYSSSYLSSYLHRNLGLNDKVQLKYKNYYCSLFMPDKKKRVEIEVTPLEEKRICVTAKVNNAKVYRKIEQKPFRLFRDIQDLEIYRQLRTEYLNCVRQHNFLSFNTEKIASMFDYELVQVFRKSYETLREPNEPYKEYMKNILRLMYEDACKRGFSQPVGQPSNAKVIKHDVDVPDIKVSSVENNKDVVSSMPDEKKLDNIDDDTDGYEYFSESNREVMSDEEFSRRFGIGKKTKKVSFEEYKRLIAAGEDDDMCDITLPREEKDRDEAIDFIMRNLYIRNGLISPDEKKIDNIDDNTNKDSFESQVKTEHVEVHEQKFSQPAEQPIDAGVVKHDNNVSDTKASSDESFGDDYGDYSSEEDRDGASLDDNEEENLGDYSSDDEDFGDDY